MSTPPADDDPAADDATDEEATANDAAPESEAAADEPGSADNTPTVSCSRCNETWELDYELDSLYAGNQAFEQFALDHERHTGHFPDDVTPWSVDCRQCPDGERFLDERPARRWAKTHARHTGHTVELTHSAETETVTQPD